MEFEGSVYKIMPVVKGTSARGEWQRQDVVFDYNDGGQFSRKLCVTFFNRPDDVAKLREGASYKVSVNLESREYNGRWYTDIRVWRLQPAESAAPEAAAPVGYEPAYGASSYAPSYSAPAAPAASSAAPAPAAPMPEIDDLPF